MPIALSTVMAAVMRRGLDITRHSSSSYSTRCPACNGPLDVAVFSGAVVFDCWEPGAFNRTDVPTPSTPCSTAAIAAALDLDARALDDVVVDYADLARLPLADTPSESVSAASDFGSLVLPRSALAHLPTPEPLIADTLLRRTSAYLSGPPGSAKSFLALDWAASIATGEPWQGREVEQGRVLYVVAEGAYGIHDRLAAWESHRGGLTIPDSGLVLFPEALQIADPGVNRRLVDYVRAEDPDLVVFDTLSRCAVGLDENSAADMSRFVAATDSVRRAMTRGSVLTLHHSTKASAGLRGSSVIEGAADTIYLTARRSGGVFALSREKAKYGPREDDHYFRLLPQSNSVVLVSTDTSPDPAAGTAAQVAWATLDRMFGESGQTFSRSEALHVLRDADEGPALGRTSSYNCLGELINRRVLVLVTTTPSDKVTRYAIDRRRAVEQGLPLWHTATIEIEPAEPDETRPF